MGQKEKLIEKLKSNPKTLRLTMPKHYWDISITKGEIKGKPAAPV